MAKTEIRSEQILDTSVTRSDLNTATIGNAVITKLIAGTNVNIGSTGVDTGTGDVTVNVNNSAIFKQTTLVIDGGGSAITAGAKIWVLIPFSCTITSWELTADVSGSIVLDIWKDTYANFPPTVADTITGTAKPSLSSQIKNQSSVLTGWTVGINAGDYLKFNVDSASTVTKIVFVLKYG
ncbi:MAG: hypothetical protein ACOYWZ_00010 [Bacillota bacterium]